MNDLQIQLKCILKLQFRGCVTSGVIENGQNDKELTTPTESTSLQMYI